jgi:amino acid transporter
MRSYEAGAHMAEETRDARTAAPRSIMGTVVCTAVCGMIYILGMLFSAPDVTTMSNPVQVRPY